MSLTTTPSGSHSVTCGSLVRADRRSVAVNRSRRRAMTFAQRGRNLPEFAVGNLRTARGPQCLRFFPITTIDDI